MQYGFYLTILTSLLWLNSHIHANSDIKVVKHENRLDLTYHNKLVLSYHLKDVTPPQGVHEAYHKNGFIHPFNSPSGHALTGIHPQDHYHHTGIWNAWVKTNYLDQNPDFWNLKNIMLAKQNKATKSTPAKVRVKSIKSMDQNGFTIHLEHIAYLNGIHQPATIILNEELSLHLSIIQNKYVVDYNILQTNITSESITFPAYRYGGGIAFRGPHHWGINNSDYLTSEGLNRSNSHATKAKWVAMFGNESPELTSQHGIAILCHPKNIDAPQYIRTWDKGQMFFNYVPAQSQPSSLKAHQSHRLNYRLIAYSGKPDKDFIEQQYRVFAKEK
jgi:hypothetical protein